MEIPQDTMERLELSFTRFRKSLFVFSIAFPLLLIVIITYQNLRFDHFESFIQDKALGGIAQNNVTEFLRGGSNTATEELEAADENIPMTRVTQGKTQNITGVNLEERIQNITGSSKTDSFASSTNKSSSRIPADKLLDGLLSSNFSEESCISRFQSYLYRKASPHKPSPYLISKLRNYENLHRRCGPRTKAYNRTMTKLTRHQKHKTAMCNYIVWTPVNGLGNRMVSMASAFLYAVLTDRVLLVEFETDMIDLFCEPFPNTSWILPKDFPFKGSQRRIEKYQSILKNERENNSQILPSVLYLDLHHTNDDPEIFFHCDHSQALVQKVPLLILASDQYFLPSLFMIPSFNRELSKMFPEKDTVFHHLGRYLFLPSNEVWGQISRFYQAHLARADERIGLQIRVFNTDLTPHQTIMDQILSCTLKNKVLPELDTRESVASPWKNQTSKSVLVASLHPQYGDKLRNMYKSKPSVTRETIDVYQPSHEEQQKFYDNKHNLKALTEIYLLSFCDVLVTSSVSSFGYVAQSLGALRPWVLYKALNKDTPNPPCQQDFSMEPCFHFPPKHHCNAKPIHDYGSSFPDTRSCMDFRNGVKLINDNK